MGHYCENFNWVNLVTRFLPLVYFLQSVSHIMLTVNLIKRRSEHFDGELGKLEEITLHQFDLENIDILPKICPRLKLLYLQGNQLTQLPVLRLHYLDTLLLQMNNMQDVYGLQECVSLRVLDLTLNFISNLHCIQGLKLNKKLKELSVEGNPIHTLPECEKFILAHLNLKKLNHSEIPSHLIEEAKVLYPNSDRDSSLYLSNYKRIEININESECIPDPEITSEKFACQTCEHTIEQRIKTARELKIIRSKENQVEVMPAKPRRKYFDENGVLQCNELELKYKYFESISTVKFKINIPRVINSCLVSCDIKSDHVMVDIKNKRLQLKSLAEMDPLNSSIIRSQASGVLEMTCYKKGLNDSEISATKKFEIEMRKSSEKLKIIDINENEVGFEIPDDIPELV
eukprot:NODE_86_length_22163_cov_0.379442.p5 type:complete len:401 gc:universal NODE_86_length_22163_cov_0.379442:94-1296(+)